MAFRSFDLKCTWWRLFQEIVVPDEVIPGTCRMHKARYQGRIQDFKLGREGAHLKKLRRAEGGAKMLGYFVWKITILPQKIIFFPILGGCAPDAPPWIRPWIYIFFALISIRNSLMVYLRKHCICLALLLPHFGLKFSNRTLFWLHEYVLRLANA